MVFYYKNRIILLCVGFVAALVACSGCGGTGGEDKDGNGIVAMINDYELRVSDFKDETGFAGTGKYLSDDPVKAKQDILEEIINKKILVQEAERENLDKEKDFMKGIERYWEQSLIRALLRKKMTELSEGITVSDDEIIAEYIRMQLRINANIVIVDEKIAAENLASSKEKYDEVKQSLKTKGSIIQEKTGWWEVGDLSGTLEKVLFSLEPGQTSYVVPENGNWVVMRVFDKGTVEIEPFADMRSFIYENILKRKKKQSLEKWIRGLRKNSRIIINRQILNSIQAE